jgi:sugar O-acyltransferase (sialic acid O-acetyltransferase NeuD family)
MQGSEPKRLVIWGATGQAKVLWEGLSQGGYRLLALFDNNSTLTSPIPGVPLLIGHQGLGSWLAESGWEAGNVGCLAAIGGLRGQERHQTQQFMASVGLRPIVAVHPAAYLAGGAVVGLGGQILAGAVVGVDAYLGEACIVNTAAVVDHDCRLGTGVHVCPGARLAGEIVVGDYATIGTGAVILPRLRIGRRAVVGAGAVVTRDVADDEVVAGVPAARLEGTSRSTHAVV